MLNSRDYNAPYQRRARIQALDASRPAAARPAEIPKSESVDIRVFFIARRRRRNLIRSSVAVCFGLALTATVFYLEVIR